MSSIIRVSNCNNINAAEIGIKENALNIKYAINGTGKSTIAKAIKLASSGAKLDSLTPFNYYGDKAKENKPNIENLSFTNVAVFDDDYLKSYVYQKSDLLKNTFEVMVVSEEYNNLKQQIDEKLKEVKNIARDKPNVTKIREIAQSLCKLLATNKDNTTLSRKTSGVKSLLEEKKSALFNLPDELQEFRPFISDEMALEWASWKLKGIQIFGEKGVCPYCAGQETETIKEKTKKFKESFDEASITFSNNLKKYLEEISEYIDQQKMQQLLASINSSADRSVLEMQLVKLKSEASYLSQRLFVLATFDGFSIDQTNMSDFESKFRDMIINEAALDFFTTEDFLSEIRPLNDQVNNVISMIGYLKGEVAKFQSYLKRHIAEKKDDINSFLRQAGFTYSFEIQIEHDNEAHAILKYQTATGESIDVDIPEKHLSWGERNAFALLMFMYDAISKKADLIILDDPISSFDSNKKYAIINRLFKTGDRENSLYQRTVLLLTHDLEPVIDYVQVGGKLSSDSVCAHFLKNTDGVLVEKPIEKNRGMLSMVALMKEISLDDQAPLPVRIGCLRKYYEHTEVSSHKSSAEYNLLSSLIHGRANPSFDTEGNDAMGLAEKEKAENAIEQFIVNFRYETFLTLLNEQSLRNMYLKESNTYYKFLILRAYIERNASARERLKEANDVLRKYADETYHIENDYIYSLDIRSFDIVPPHFLKAADEFMLKEETYLKFPAKDNP